MKKTTNYYIVDRSNIVAMVPKNIRTILDIGCAKGTFLKSVKEQTNAETWGIEIVTDIANNAKDNVDNILIGKIEDLIDSIPDNYFDCITFNDVLEHLLEPTDVLKKIRSKLAPKGIIIASIPNVRYFKNIYELIVKKDWEYKETGILDSTHLRFFTKISMRRMFENAGYKLIKQEGINKPTSRKFQILNFLTMGILKDMKYLQFVCIATTIEY